MRLLNVKYPISVYSFILLLASIVYQPVLAAKYALLIGIENYLDTPHFRERGMQQLAGPLNDIELLKQLLLSENFQFLNDNITTLLDNQATHSGIEKAFNDLAERVKPNDFVYIHYSGHGSVHSNFDDDEISGMDQTWVTYGAYNSESKDSYDILDDQINLWLTEIGKKTDRIVFVSDSCHSGSVSRGQLLGIRTIRKDDRPYPKVKRFADLESVGIRIGASGDTENAYEYQIEGKSFGRFTWHWVQSLNTVKPGETWRDAFTRTEVLMREETITGYNRILQQPQIAAPRHQNLYEFVIDNSVTKKFTGSPSRIYITAVKDDHIRLSAGALNKVTKGSIYTTPYANEVTEIVVTHVTPFFSEARTTKGTAKVGDVLIEQHQAFSFPPTPIVIEGDSILGKDQIKRASDLIAAELNPQEYQLVNDRQPYGLIIRLFNPEISNDKYTKEKIDATLPKVFSKSSLKASIVSMQENVLDDSLLTNLSDLEVGVKNLAKKMKILADLRDLEILTNDLLDIDIDVYGHQLISDDTCSKTDLLDSCFLIDRMYRATETINMNQINGSFKLPQDNIIGFSIKNNSKFPYYVYLLNLSIREGVILHFPPTSRNMEYAKLEPNQARKLDGALHFPYLGQEKLKFIFSKEPLNLSALEFTGTNKLEESKDDTRGPINHLEKLLNQTARRAERILAPAPNDWGTLQIDLIIVANDQNR